jgi:Protein of unknown function (DUF2442)
MATQLSHSQRPWSTSRISTSSSSDSATDGGLCFRSRTLQGLAKATDEQIQNYELLGRGTGMSLPDLDVDLYVPALIEGIYGNRRWMTHLGRKGGKAKTVAKRLASQTNGAKGGRPKTAAAASL